MRISLYFLLAVCLLLAIGSAIFSGVLVTQDHNSQLNQLQHNTAMAQVEAFRAFITIAMNFMSSETETSVRRLKFMASSRNASFLTDPEKYSQDLNDSLVVEWMPQAPSPGEAFWSFTALYPVSSYPDWEVALAAQHMAETRRDGSRSQFACMPNGGQSNVSYCNLVTWDDTRGIPTIHQPYTYTFNGCDGLGNTSGINYFTPMYVWVSQDGWAYWYLTHQTLVMVNGVQVIVQTMDSIERLATNLALIKDNGAEFIIVDQFLNVVATTIQAVQTYVHSCCDSTNTDCTDCISHPASSHPVKLIQEAYGQLYVPSIDNVSLPCAISQVKDIKLSGNPYVGITACGVNTGQLRLTILWFQPQSSTDKVSMALVIAVGILAVAPTLILCIACIIAILIPMNSMSNLMQTLAYDFVEEEPENTEIPAIYSCFLEIQYMATSFMTLGETILTVVKYVPRDLVRKDVAALLGIEDESEEYMHAMQELEEEGEIEVMEDMESSRVAGVSFHVTPVCPKGSAPTSAESSIASSGAVTPFAQTNRRPSRFVGIVGMASQSSFMGSTMHASRTTQGALRKVAVVFVNLSGFHISSRVMEQFPKVVSAIEQCAKKSKGVLDSFHGDHFLVTFNALTTCALYSRGAISFYCDLKEMLDGMRVEFTAGIAAGEATVGILGSDTSKKFSVVSSVVTDAAALERHCVHVIPHARCLAYGSLSSEAAYVAHFHYCRPLQFSYATMKTHVLSIYRKTAPSAVDEWMYELEENTKKDPFHYVNALARSFLSGEDPLAKLKAQSKLDQLPHSLDKDSLEVTAFKELLEL